jgi:hypothetical protein
MISSPWKGFATPWDGKDYVALLSYLPLKQYWMIPKFLRLTRETQQQLAKSNGLVGYSVGAELLSRRFWTVSVWENRQSLMDFVHEIPHSRIMQVLVPDMGKTRFAEWTVRTAEIPVRWSDAKRHMAGIVGGA